MQLHELEQKVLLDTINLFKCFAWPKFVELSNNNVAVLERQFLETDRFQLGEVTRTASSWIYLAAANLTAKVGSLKISSELFLSLVGIKPYKLMNIKTNFKLPSSLEITNKIH